MKINVDKADLVCYCFLQNDHRTTHNASQRNLRNPSRELCVYVERGRSACRETLGGFSLGDLLFDTADEISNGTDYPLARASLTDKVNTTVRGATRGLNRPLYKDVQAEFECSKGCRRCDDDEGRTRNTDSAKGKGQYIADNSSKRELVSSGAMQSEHWWGLAIKRHLC